MKKMIPRISPHISYLEAVHSFTAKKCGIENTPSAEAIENMKRLAFQVFEPLREWVKGPIKINSFFRNPTVNTLIGGVKNSQHLLGIAMDIDDVYGYKTNAEMYEYIKKNLAFDQLIWEYGNDKNPAWIHVSYKEFGNRMHAFRIGV